MYLSGVRAHAGKALIPAFGSRTIPSGDTLRVLLALWGAPNRGRLVELLRSEPSRPLGPRAVLRHARRRCTPNELARPLRCGRNGPTPSSSTTRCSATSSPSRPGRDMTMADHAAVCVAGAGHHPTWPVSCPLVTFYGLQPRARPGPRHDGFLSRRRWPQLGKSARLRAAAPRVQRRDSTAMRSTNRSTGVGQDIPAEAVWTTLWPRLAEKGIVPADMPSARHRGAPLTTHITDWVQWSTRTAAAPAPRRVRRPPRRRRQRGVLPRVTAFKDLMEGTGRAVKVVFAGLHQTARFERLSNHPLAHLGKPVCVGPLTPQYAYDLLTVPLRALGYRFRTTRRRPGPGPPTISRPLSSCSARICCAASKKSLPRKARHHASSPPPTSTPSGPTRSCAPSSCAGSTGPSTWTRGTRSSPTASRTMPTPSGIESALSPTELRSDCVQWWPKGFAAKDVLTGEFRALL